MSDEEFEASGDDPKPSEPEPEPESAVEEEEEGESKMAADDGPSEAELAMQKRRGGGGDGVDDEEAEQLLEDNRKLRAEMEKEIQELRARSERRKLERVEEEKRAAAQRQEDEAKRREEEDGRKREKEDADDKKKQDRIDKMAALDKLKNTARPNFVISKKAETPGIPAAAEEEDEGKEKKSKEQMEAERKAILEQRIKPLEISGFDQGKLTEKAKELYKDVYRLESEKYDLEKRFKEQQYDMMELAERARQMNKVGKGGLKRIQLGPDDEVDKIQNQFAGAPAKVEMYSKFERQQDKRIYGERQVIFTGPVYGFPAEKITARKTIKWDENSGLPTYVFLPGFTDEDEEEGEGEAVEEE
jgi:hypothetical protein